MQNADRPIIKISGRFYEVQPDGAIKRTVRVRSRVRREPPILTRVATLHRWKNYQTGEQVKKTIAEFIRHTGEPKHVAQNLIGQTILSRNGWSHEATMHKVIQGDAVEWLTSGHVSGGSKSAQYRDAVSKVWDKWTLVLAKYRSGLGIKKIAREMGFSVTAIIGVLNECGENTAMKRTHAHDRPRVCAKTQRRKRYAKTKADPAALLKQRTMSRIWSAMKRQNVNGSGTFAVVGCTPDQLRQHIEKQFQPGMSFDNYGEWHVDHIRPCASFDLNDPAQFTECFNWRNLQPLWATDNLRKSDTYAQN
jgi:hypothetical protein